MCSSLSWWNAFDPRVAHYWFVHTGSFQGLNGNSSNKILVSIGYLFIYLLTYLFIYFQHDCIIDWMQDGTGCSRSIRTGCSLTQRAMPTSKRSVLTALVCWQSSSNSTAESLPILLQCSCLEPVCWLPVWAPFDSCINRTRTVYVNAHFCRPTVWCIV